MDEISKSAIQELLNNTPNISQNGALIQRLQGLLRAKRILRDPFSYVITFASIAAAANSTETVNIQADSDFLIQAQNYMVDIAAAIQTDSSRVIPIATVLMTDTGSGRQLMDNEQPLSSIFGTGMEPYVLPQPKLMSARSSLSVKVTNTSASTTYTSLKLSFIGVKLFTL